MGIFGKKTKPEETKTAEEIKPEVSRSASASTKADKKARTGKQVLVRPLLSEKATRLAAAGQYVFAVMRGSNKPEIKKDIERLYSVHVESVNIVNMPGKKRRYGKSQGKTSEWRKAVIKVRAGEKIPGILESVG
ncbi:MAG: 50S ribosomal protein L23 [Candidatus Doudnabacteria bacterium]|nr:50S ribosomal protein L23 [Candidatus Doudnabacteria bacterium]